MYIPSSADPYTASFALSSITTYPGSPAYVGKATSYRRNSAAKYGLNDVSLTNHNAIQGTFAFSA